MDLGGEKNLSATEDLDENSQAFSDADAVQAHSIGGNQIGPKILAVPYIWPNKGYFSKLQIYFNFGRILFHELLISVIWFTRIWPLFIEFQGMKQLSCGFFMME